MRKPIAEKEDLCFAGIRGIWNFKRTPKRGERPYKVEAISFDDDGRHIEYCIVGPDGTWAEANTSPKAAIHEALAVIPGITINDIDFFEGVKSGYKAFGWGVDNWLSSETAALNRQQVVVLLQLGISKVVIAWDADVSWEKIRKETKSLRNFVNVYAVRDFEGLLGKAEDKMSPVDKGREIWEILYKERKKVL